MWWASDGHLVYRICFLIVPWVHSLPEENWRLGELLVKDWVADLERGNLCLEEEGYGSENSRRSEGGVWGMNGALMLEGFILKAVGRGELCGPETQKFVAGILWWLSVSCSVKKDSEPQ